MHLSAISPSSDRCICWAVIICCVLDKCGSKYCESQTLTLTETPATNCISLSCLVALFTTCRLVDLRWQSLSHLFPTYGVHSAHLLYHICSPLLCCYVGKALCNNLVEAAIGRVSRAIGHSCPMRIQASPPRASAPEAPKLVVPRRCIVWNHMYLSSIWVEMKCVVLVCSAENIDFHNPFGMISC